MWKTEKASVMDKFKAKHPTNAEFEEKLAKYAKLGDDVFRQASLVMQQCSLHAAPPNVVLKACWTDKGMHGIVINHH